MRKLRQKQGGERTSPRLGVTRATWGMRRRRRKRRHPSTPLTPMLLRHHMHPPHTYTNSTAPPQPRPNRTHKDPHLVGSLALALELALALDLHLALPVPEEHADFARARAVLMHLTHKEHIRNTFGLRESNSGTNTSAHVQRSGFRV